MRKKRKIYRTRKFAHLLIFSIFFKFSMNIHSSTSVRWLRAQLELFKPFGETSYNQRFDFIHWHQIFETSPAFFVEVNIHNSDS